MSLVALYENSATIGGTEYSLPANSTSLASITTDGCYQIYIDFSAITAVADEFEVIVYERIRSSEGQRAIYGPVSIQRPEVLIIPSLLLINGWDVTVRKISGTDRSIAWSIRQIAGNTITAPYEASATIGSSEYSMPNGSTSLTPITVDGIYQLFMVISACTYADEFEVKIYEKVTSGGTQRTLEQRFSFNSDNTIVLPAKIFVHGWDMTVKKIAGTDRSVSYSIRKIA